MFDAGSAPQECFLVWLRGTRTLHAQKWAELDFGAHNWRKQDVVAWQPLLEAEFHLSIDELARRYPPERCAARP